MLCQFFFLSHIYAILFKKENLFHFAASYRHSCTCILYNVLVCVWHRLAQNIVLTEFISLNAATLWVSGTRPNRIHFCHIAFPKNGKIPQLYLNGIVIASLSAASGTRWILTACRFKICFTKTNHFQPTKHSIRKPKTYSIQTYLYERFTPNWTTFGK